MSTKATTTQVLWLLLQPQSWGPGFWLIGHLRKMVNISGLDSKCDPEADCTCGPQPPTQAHLTQSCSRSWQMQHVSCSSILSGFPATALTPSGALWVFLPWSVTNKCRFRSGSPSAKERDRLWQSCPRRKQDACSFHFMKVLTCGQNTVLASVLRAFLTRSLTSLIFQSTEVLL